MALLKLGENIGIMSDNEKIEFSKFKSKLDAEVKKKIKPDRCLYCGEKTSQLCNSHTIPQFILRRLSNEIGEIYNSNILIKMPMLMNNVNGIKSAGVFKLICRNCDSQLFSDYENPVTYTDKKLITDKVLAQIELKTYLKKMNIRYYEREMIKEISKLGENILEEREKFVELDIKENELYIKEAKDIVERENINNKHYKLAYYKKLNYVVPVAFQDVLVLITGFDGNVINDIYNEDPNYVLQGLHICIFPLENSSVIMMFHSKKDTRYEKFFKDFNKYKLNEQLSIISYIILLYSEEFFLSKKIKEELLRNKKINDVAQQTPINETNIMEIFQKVSLKLAVNKYDLNNYKDIPNLLSKKYAISR